MNRKKLVMTAAAAAVLLGLSACTSDETDTASETTTAVETTATSGSSTTEQAEESAQHSEADVMFAQMMIPHHEQAIEMSDIILSKDDVPADVTSLAEEIKAAQGPEIAQLTDWLEQWGEATEPQDGHGGHDMSMMEGMLSDDELEQLSDAQGADAARMFLEQMIAHHQGAIDMAEVLLEHGKNEQMRALAEEIITAQVGEIELMTTWLSENAK